ncbi:Mga2p KNAG_0M02410 [Huiozyma naganishii CBS 8797]|uniref:IPT/TIG domain-containing protein n=1 Tax=Huiozyma naganishii (strain ATCC MYA-139 / BCRC 22969 / CBS 8797 / KCTC 17520 / NBRC 10181 / NCYC 3082 / Yp74L-3) TaxID=1071383 RepID=J7SAV8_HUIN7|nr:hypothetical protein KNAG_0M02410 [Kazachstania naganishii CBS 8797]CCK73094.1 hypothetical protein KNAG_0M02410 [Kazachstania naganishii CBS 8797]
MDENTEALHFMANSFEDDANGGPDGIVFEKPNEDAQLPGNGDIDMLQFETNIFNQYVLHGGDPHAGVDNVGNVGSFDPNCVLGKEEEPDFFQHFAKTENTPIMDQFSSPPGVGLMTPEGVYSGPPQTLRGVSPANVDDSHALADSTDTRDSQLMENKFQTLVDNTINFGRTDPIVPHFVDPAQYLAIDSGKLPHSMRIRGLPQVTRVENQLQLLIDITPPVNKYMVHLPTDSITRDKFFLSKGIREYPKSFQDQLLFVDAFLLDAKTNMNISVCMKCVKREQRRASRRKSGLSDNMLWCNNDSRRAVIFNNNQITVIHRTDANTKQLELTTRIVCYCRHHKSDDGFRLFFVLKDSDNTVLSHSISDPIMITDKKQHGRNSNAAENVPLLSTGDTTKNSSANVYAFAVNNTTHRDTVSDSTTSSKYFDVGEIPTIDDIPISANALVAPSTAFGPPTSTINNIQGNVRSRIIPSPTSMSEEGSEPFASEYRSNYPPSAGRPTKRTRSSMNLQRPLRHNDFTSARSGTSLNALHNPSDFSNVHITPRNPARVQSTVPSDQITLEEPSIQRVIPSRGPINGGIEITLLGSKFKQGLIVQFGGNIALSTQCWSETTILTYLPPAATAGQVFVTITDPNEPDQSELQQMGVDIGKKAIFTYVDETDRQLIELALQIVGLKMNGKLEDARNIAQRILDDDTKSPSAQEQHNNTTPNGGNQYSKELVTDDEQLIVQVIKSLNKSTSNFSMCDSLGRTLLHLASLKGYFNLASTLVRSGVNIALKDSFGFTPLHFAAISGSFKIIRLLLSCKAGVSLKACNGMTPKELYINNHKLQNNIQDDVLDLFDYYLDERKGRNTGGIGDLPGIRKELSQSSIDSNMLDEKSVTSLNDAEQGTHTKKPEFSNSAFPSPSSIVYMDSSEYEEEAECDFEDNNDMTSSNYEESVISSVRSEGSSEQAEEAERSTLAPNGEPADKSSAEDLATDRQGSDFEESIPNTNETSLWSRMLNRINDDLPKYDDLFPRPVAGETVKPVEETAVGTTATRPLSSDMHTSSEDEEESVQNRFHLFFQNNRQDLQNDKMLLFFWIPLMLVLSTWVLWITFSRNETDVVNKANNFISHYLRLWLGKILLGNQRMRTMFMDGFTNLQTSGILNDLIVS